MSDCGPACLAMVARYYRGSVSIAKIREQTGTNSMGTSLRALSDGAASIGFKPVAIKSVENEGEDCLSEVSLPCIAHMIVDEDLLLADAILDSQPYHSENEEIDWEKSSIRAWLNNEFINKAFSNEENKAINTVELINKDNYSQYAQMVQQMFGKKASSNDPLAQCDYGNFSLRFKPVDINFTKPNWDTIMTKRDKPAMSEEEFDEAIKELARKEFATGKRDDDDYSGLLWGAAFGAA